MSVINELNLDTAPRYEKHAAAVEFLGEIARDVFDAPLSEETLENWRLANLLIRDVDSIFDGDNSLLQESTTAFLTETFESPPLESRSTVVGETTAALAKDLRQRISERQSRLFLKRGLQIIDLQKEMSKVSDPQEYARLILLEGQLQCSMFLHIMNPKDSAQPNYERFSRFFLTGSALGNLWDSVVDLKTDYTQGQTVVQPDRSNRLEMIKTAGPDLRRALGYIPLADLPKFVRPAIMIAGDRKRTPYM